MLDLLNWGEGHPMASSGVPLGFVAYLFLLISSAPAGQHRVLHPHLSFAVGLAAQKHALEQS